MSQTFPLSPFDVLTTYVAANATDVPFVTGQIGITSDGRRFKGAVLAISKTTLAQNKLNQQQAVTANMQAVTLSAQSIGDTTVTITCSAQTLTANQLAGAYLGIISGTGSVQTLKIKGNPAGTSATTYLLTLQDPFYIATSGSPVANIWVDPYLNPIISPTTATGTVIGTSLVNVASDTTYNTYFWVQTNGPCLILADAGATAGASIMPSSNTAGAVMGFAASTTAQMNLIGTFDQSSTSATYSFATLNLW